MSLSRDELPIAPPRNRRNKPKSGERPKISAPFDFRHLAHLSLNDSTLLDIAGRPEDDVTASQQTSNTENLYEKPTSSKIGSPTSTFGKRQQNDMLDTVFPAAPANGNDSKARNYENQPTEHVYENFTANRSPMPSLPPKRSIKKTLAPMPPKKDPKPGLVGDATTPDEPAPLAVAFRPSKMSESSEFPEEEAPKISTPTRIEPPKANSMILERPNFLGATMTLGLDDPFPLRQSPLPRSFSPVTMRETPILCTTSPTSSAGVGYITPKSTSPTAEGVGILDDLDAWLDDMNEEDKKRVSQICFEETGCARPQDKVFIRDLILRFEKEKDAKVPKTGYVGVPKKKAPSPPHSISATSTTAKPANGNYELLRRTPDISTNGSKKNGNVYTNSPSTKQTAVERKSSAASLDSLDGPAKFAADRNGIDNDDTTSLSSTAEKISQKSRGSQNSPSSASDKQKSLTRNTQPTVVVAVEQPVQPETAPLLEVQPTPQPAQPPVPRPRTRISTPTDSPVSSAPSVEEAKQKKSSNKLEKQQSPKKLLTPVPEEKEKIPDDFAVITVKKNLKIKFESSGESTPLSSDDDEEVYRF